MSIDRTGPGSNAEVGTPDGPYVLVSGLYAAAMLSPPAVVGLSSLVSGAGALYVGFLATVVALAGVSGWIVSRSAGLPVAIGCHDSAWLLVAAPFAWFLGLFGIISLAFELPTVAIPATMVGSVGGMLLGIGLVIMSRNRHATVATADRPVVAEWSARWTQRTRRLLGIAAGFGLSLSLVGVFARLGVVPSSLEVLYPLLFVSIPPGQRRVQRTNLHGHRAGPCGRLPPPATVPTLVGVHDRRADRRRHCDPIATLLGPRPPVRHR